ncbi:MULTISPECIES: DUF2946 family protein [unclassified Mesorhizobium]|uniref:DUF2946 family protein n=1 Tax=unclassified Mesorhizobium TaxID=325217 RepID=UPI001093FF79|nr:MULTISPECIES: DUF2946 family protein [unclassified Mesorhizobium]TGQ93171.1 DUF2946 domain-containing protein [Mesorhizobium sp. M8A.F.Ca.ET.208.01.1.1]TGT46568.1 DUF2946 domain-containing protein [Mesorhizobium sp. M8A.F.Ca.ET.165.01.1.1]TGT53068.1 DUF2946 domain-containing protein [Mesorhizobium sp. M8A.F.Ca.ET.167.01.1.1]
MPVVLVAAYLLLLQSTLGAFALSTAPSAAQLDAFGNVICTHDGASQLPGGDQHPSHLPACCTLGCGMFSPAYAPPPDAGLALASLSFEAVAFVFPATTHLDFARERSPSNPRAPPLAG